MLTSAVVFGILHGPGFLSALLAGLVLGILVIRTGSLVPAIALHVAWNAVASLLGINCPFCRYPALAWTSSLIVLGVLLWAARGTLGRLAGWARSELALSPRQAGRELAFMARHGSFWLLFLAVVAGMTMALVIKAG